MKKPTKSQLLATAAITIGLIGAGTGLSKAAATDSSNGTVNPVSNLVTAIAQKFNLNSTDVQQVFDEERQQIVAQRLEDIKTKLTEAVAAGKLTQTQVNSIVAKQAELEASRASDHERFSTLSQEERRAAMETKKDEIDAWAAINNIPVEYLRFLIGGGKGGPRHGGPGFGGDRGPAPFEAMTPAMPSSN